MNIAIIFLAGLIQSSLQLSFGALILLYHSSISKHYKKTTRRLSRSYVIGCGVMSFLAVGCTAFLISVLNQGAMSTQTLIILIGALLASALIMWFFYFRKGDRTELWLPRSFARFISGRARKTNDPIEAFSLGVVSSFAEMPISLALYITSANAILQLNGSLQVAGLIVFAALAILPLVVLKIRMKTGRNVVDAQRWRVQNKAFLKIISGIGFITLAATIFSFWVI